MPAAYFDTSALVKRYVREVGSSWVRRTLAQPTRNVIYTSFLAHPEVLSALQRKVREGELATADALAVHQRLQQYGGPALLFVAADATLLAAATAEGLAVDNPQWHP